MQVETHWHNYFDKESSETKAGLWIKIGLFFECKTIVSKVNNQLLCPRTKHCSVISYDIWWRTYLWFYEWVYSSGGQRLCFNWTLKNRSSIRQEWITSLICGFALYLTAYYMSLLLDVLSEYSWSVFPPYRSAQLPLYINLTWLVFFVFFLPLAIALSLFSIYSLSLHLDFNTPPPPPPPPPPPLSSLSKDGEYGNSRKNPTNFDKTSPFISFFSQLCSAFSQCVWTGNR